MNKRQPPAPAAPPAPSELLFQPCQFHDRIQDAPPPVNLGAKFFASHGRDMSLKAMLAEKLDKVGDVLRVDKNNRVS